MSLTTTTRQPKLSTPQFDVIQNIAQRGLVPANSIPRATLKALLKSGLVEKTFDFHCGVTEAGLKAVDERFIPQVLLTKYREAWKLASATITHNVSFLETRQGGWASMAPISYMLSQKYQGRFDERIDTYSDTLDIAIELTRAELRATR